MQLPRLPALLLAVWPASVTLAETPAIDGVFSDWGREHLVAQDQVKFVLCDEQDYSWAKLKCDELDLAGKVSDILFSPSHGELKPTDLANWIVRDRLHVRMQLQLHKLLWGDEPGR